MNTFGAVVGTVAAGFFLIEALGVRWTLGIGIAINFAVAAIAIALTQKGSATEVDGPPEEPKHADAEDALYRPERRLVLWAIGISGFCALAYEVLWTRIMVFFLGSTTYAFATMLAAFLFGHRIREHGVFALGRPD